MAYLVVDDYGKAAFVLLPCTAMAIPAPEMR